MYKIKNTPYILCSTAKVGDYKKRPVNKLLKQEKRLVAKINQKYKVKIIIDSIVYSKKITIKGLISTTLFYGKAIQKNKIPESLKQ